jgi:uncharacterized membrane protein (UPF0127 family)
VTSTPPAAPKQGLRSEAGLRRLGVIVTAMFVIGVLLLLANGGSSPANPYEATARPPFQSFDEARLTVNPGPGLVSRLDNTCSLLAGTPDQQQRGMMGHRDFGSYRAMVFLFPQESTVTFYNRDVPIALSVAWFSADGSFITSKDLEPCADVRGCPTIASTAPFRYAIEVKKGGLPSIGVGPGSSISVAPGCGAH